MGGAVGDLALQPVTITIAFQRARGSGKIVATTWGVVAGRYGSLGRVTIPVESMPEIVDRDSLARVLLTALYGLDYDL